MMSVSPMIPEQWKGLFELAITPINWLIILHQNILARVWGADVWWEAALKRFFLFLPAVAVLIGLWCTLLAAYTLVFRHRRLNLLGTLLVLWWDVARSLWLFWAGMGKFVIVMIGTCSGLVRLVTGILLEMVREIFELPFVLTGRFTASLRQPGVPWIAFLMTIGWGALEAGVFAYILSPTMGEIVSDLVGGADTHRYLVPVLFVMLFFLISGSFACLNVLVEALEKKDIKAIIQMVIVEVFVMFVEVAFLYRELIDSLTPWIASQTGWQMGIVPVTILSSFGWVGIRAMTWFLFARYGTPTLLALIARQRLSNETSPKSANAGTEQRVDVIFKKLKSEQVWFKDEANELLEAAVLPIFQVVATTLNFMFVLFLSKPLFSVPLKDLAQAGETKTLLQNLVSLKEAGK
jgi:hypothetical protein